MAKHSKSLVDDGNGLPSLKSPAIKWLIVPYIHEADIVLQANRVC